MRGNSGTSPWDTPLNSPSLSYCLYLPEVHTHTHTQYLICVWCVFLHEQSLAPFTSKQPTAFLVVFCLRKKKSIFNVYQERSKGHIYLLRCCRSGQVKPTKEYSKKTVKRPLKAVLQHGSQLKTFPHTKNKIKINGASEWTLEDHLSQLWILILSDACLQTVGPGLLLITPSTLFFIRGGQFFPEFAWRRNENLSRLFKTRFLQQEGGWTCLHLSQWYYSSLSN